MSERATWLQRLSERRELPWQPPQIQGSGCFCFTGLKTHVFVSLPESIKPWDTNSY